MPTRREAIQNVTAHLRGMEDGTTVLGFYKLPSRLWRHGSTGLSHTAETIAEKLVDTYSTNRKGDVYRSRYAESRLTDLECEVAEKSVIIAILRALLAEPQEAPTIRPVVPDGAMMTLARNPESEDADGQHE